MVRWIYGSKALTGLSRCVVFVAAMHAGGQALAQPRALPQYRATYELLYKSDQIGTATVEVGFNDETERYQIAEQVAGPRWLQPHRVALVAELDEPERIRADSLPSDGPGRDTTDLR